MTTDANQAVRRPADSLNRLCGQQVAITFGNENRQYFCFCWGMCRERFFLTQIPMDSEIQDKLIQGKSAVIRFVESGMVCGFKTRIHQVLTFPFRMIFFDYPDSLEVINLRSAKRVAVFLPATIQWHGEEYEGAIRDLSEGGCYFVMKYWQDEIFNDLAVGSTFPIKFQMHGEKSFTELECKVVRMNKDQEELRLGLSFQKSRRNIISKIGSFVSHISKLLESGQSG